MTLSPNKAGLLLKEGIILLYAAYLSKGMDKSIRAIEDELGCVIGKEGHTIRKWKAGVMPLTPAFYDEFLQAAETLTKWMVALRNPYPDWSWGERFLRSVGHPAPKGISGAARTQEEPSRTNQSASCQQSGQIQLQIVMNFTLPRDTSSKEVEMLFWRLRGVVGEIG